MLPSSYFALGTRFAIFLVACNCSKLYFKNWFKLKQHTNLMRPFAFVGIVTIEDERNWVLSWWQSSCRRQSYEQQDGQSTIHVDWKETTLHLVKWFSSFVTILLIEQRKFIPFRALVWDHVLVMVKSPCETRVFILSLMWTSTTVWNQSISCHIDDSHIYQYIL